LLDWLILCTAGFSLICGAVLLVAYLWSPLFPGKTWQSRSAVTVLTAVLLALQGMHTGFVLEELPLMSLWLYRLALAIGPVAFFWAGRALIMPDASLRAWHLLHLLPPLLALFALPPQIGLPLMFAIGSSYALWLGVRVYRVRDQRRQRRFEGLFSVVVTLSAIAVLAAAVTAPWLEPRTFVAVYSSAVAVAYALVLFALVAIADFVRDLFEATQARYSVTRLRDVDVPACVDRLERLMDRDRLYQQDDLSLSGVAEALDITPHQLSELINSHLGLSFSRYLRSKRLADACRLLREKPEQSVLSIALEVGYRSQSTFYAAFREEMQQSPGEYRADAATGDAVGTQASR